MGHRWVIEGHFAGRLEDGPFWLSGGPLAGGVETSDTFKGIAEKIQAERIVSSGRKNIDNAAANSEFARFHDDVRPDIAITIKVLNNIVGIDSATRDEGEC